MTDSTQRAVTDYNAHGATRHDGGTTCTICGEPVHMKAVGLDFRPVHTRSLAVFGWNPDGVRHENYGKKRDRPLNEIMEFDHVIRVHPGGQITSDRKDHAPEGWYDGELSQGIDGKWQLMTGYSGQDRYNGPCMHNSEFIGGGMERDIRSTPGLYVALVCQYTYATDDDDDHDYSESSYDEGWVVAYIHDDV